MNKNRSGNFAVGLSLIALMLLFAAGNVSAQAEATVADKLAEAINSYSNLEFDKGLDVTNALLKRADLTSKDSIAIYAVMSMINYGKGELYCRL